MKEFFYEKDSFLEYFDVGDSKKVLLVFHGLFGSIKQKELAEFLNSKDIRVVFISRVGFGDSTYKKLNSYKDYSLIVKDLLESLGIEKFSVLGISAGAIHSYSLASLLKQKVENLFIYSGMGAVNKDEILKCYENYEETKKAYEYFEKSSHKECASFILNAYEAFLTKEFKQSDDYKDSLANDTKALGQEIQLQAKKWNFNLEDIESNIYINHAKDDEVVPLKSVEKTMNYLTNAKIDIKDSGGHFSQENFLEFLNFISLKIR